MPGAHRNADARNCGATTTVVGQSSVFVNGRLWAVLDDTNIHGNGQLINTTGSSVIIEGKPVIVHGPDDAKPDNAGHPNPKTGAGSGNVEAY